MADGTPPHVIGHLENSVVDPDPKGIRIFLGLVDPDPDPLVRGTDPDQPLIKQK
jgi:hypothetical protein